MSEQFLCQKGMHLKTCNEVVRTINTFTATVCAFIFSKALFKHAFKFFEIFWHLNVNKFLYRQKCVSQKLQ